jgi:hypothetical protein
MLNRRVTAVLSLVLATAIWGCGAKDEGPARVDVSGTVTYQGNPVPRGFVTFYPDTTKGTTGPTSKAKIVEGRYDTRAEGSSAPISGDLIVEVNGFGPPVPNEEVPAPLFKAYRTDLSLKAESQVFDIEVPAGK